MDASAAAAVSVQQHVASLLRTGHPLLDGIITAFVISVCTFALAHGKSAAKRAWRALGDVFACASGRTFSVRVTKYDDTTCLMNAYYAAVMWHVTDRTRMDTDEALLTRSHLTTKFLPADAKPVTIRMGTRAVTLTTKHDTENQTGRRFNERMHLELVVADNEARGGGGLYILRGLLEDVAAEHAAHLRSSSWTQRLFRLKKAPGASSSPQTEPLDKTVWTSKPTHSSKSFASVVLDEHMKAEVQRDLDAFLGAERWYADMGISYKRGYLFHGPPGTGKTSLVGAIANRAKYDIYRLDLSKVRTDMQLDELFDTLPERCVVLLEDVDCMGGVVRKRPPIQTTISFEVEGDDKNAADGQGWSHLTLSAVLNNLDGVGSNHGRIFIMTSNHADVLDPALVRPGRVDVSLRLGMCGHAQIRAFFALYCGDSDDATNSANRVCAEVPEGELSPSEMSSLLLRFKADAAGAASKLLEMRLHRRLEMAQAHCEFGWGAFKN